MCCENWWCRYSLALAMSTIIFAASLAVSAIHAESLDTVPRVGTVPTGRAP